MPKKLEKRLNMLSSSKKGMKETQIESLLVKNTPDDINGILDIEEVKITELEDLAIEIILKEAERKNSLI